MSDLGLKTTLYDIIGYSVPGIVIIKLNGIIGLLNGYIPPGLNEVAEKYPFIYYLIISYFTGHIISYFSSVTIENIYRYSFGKDTLIFLHPQAKQSFQNAFKNEYGWEYRGNDFYGMANAVSDSKPKTYDTAFNFLSFYGMSRNLCMVFICIAIECIIMKMFPYAIITTAGSVFLFLIYKKFFKIYHISIYYGFLNMKSRIE